MWKETATTLGTLLVLNACGPNVEKTQVVKEPTKKEIANKKYHAEIDSLYKDNPHFVYWDSVFKDTTKSTLFFNKNYNLPSLEPGEEILKLHHDSTWTKEYLTRQFNINLGKKTGFENPFTDDLVGSLWRNKRKVGNILEKVVGRVAYNDSRGKFIKNKLEKYGSLIRTAKEIYSRHSLPEDMAAHIVVESGFDPLARSGAGAVGLTQILRSYFLDFSNYFDQRIDWRDPVLMMKFGASWLDAASKLNDGHYTPSHTTFQAGIGNVEKLKTMGRAEIGDSASVLEQYITGIEIADLSQAIEDNRFLGSLKTSSVNHVAMISEAIGLMNSFEKKKHQPLLHTYVANREWDVGELSSITGVSRNSLLTYNPHFGRDGKLPPNSNVNLPYHIEGFGREVPMDNTSNVYKEWREFKIDSLNPSLENKFQYFSEKFRDVNPVYSAVLNRFSKMIDDFYHTDANGESVAEEHRQLGRERPWRPLASPKLKR